jgi:Carboxypeptidase regulatory-like domain
MTVPALCLCLLLQQPHAPLAALTSISETTGGIRADIQSSEGLPVAGVQVRLKHRDGRVWATLTDRKGHFQAGGLPPGEYQIESRLAGFKGESCAIQIKSQAWLLGVPTHPSALRKTGAKVLHFQGPSTYETPKAVIQPQKRPELGKIPMH